MMCVSNFLNFFEIFTKPGASKFISARRLKMRERIERAARASRLSIDGRCASRISSKFSPAPENA